MGLVVAYQEHKEAAPPPPQQELVKQTIGVTRVTDSVNITKKRTMKKWEEMENKTSEEEMFTIQGAKTV